MVLTSALADYLNGLGGSNPPSPANKFNGGYMKIYRIYNKKTKKFKTAGHYGWSPIGKFWSTIGHVRLAITNIRKQYDRWCSNTPSPIKETGLHRCEVIEYELTEINRWSVEDFIKT